MFSVKAWDLGAVVRLLASIFICMYAGSLLATVVHYLRAGGTLGGWVFPLTVAALGCLIGAMILLHKGWVLENFMPRMMGLVLCFYLGLVIGAWAQKLAGPVPSSTAQILIGALSFQCATVVLVWLFLSNQHSGWAETFGFHNH